MLMNGVSLLLVEPSFRELLFFRRQGELSGQALVLSYQILTKGVILFLGSITLILPTV